MGFLKRWSLKRWRKRQVEGKLDEKHKRDALKALASYPTKDYLIALMGELVREGIYLPPEKQIGARYTVELLSQELRKGQKFIEQDTKK